MKSEDWDERWVYDGLGLLAEHYDYAKNKTVYTYNLRGLLDTADYYRYDSGSYSLGSTTEYTYDALGNRTAVTVGSDTYDYDYDVEGRLTSVTSPQGVVAYQYHPVTGRREIVALLILLVNPGNSGRAAGLVRRCPVCDKALIGNASYCSECGSKI